MICAVSTLAVVKVSRLPYLQTSQTSLTITNPNLLPKYKPRGDTHLSSCHITDPQHIDRNTLLTTRDCSLARPISFGTFEDPLAHAL